MVVCRGDTRPFLEAKGGGGWWRMPGVGKGRCCCPAAGRAALEPGTAVRMLVKVMNMQTNSRAAWREKGDLGAVGR